VLAASEGENLGFRLLPEVRTFAAADLPKVPLELAARVRWLDWLVANMDRSPENPNIIVDRAGCWLIDHGASLPFQHDWAAVTEDSPVRPVPVLPHVFDSLDLDLPRRDRELTACITREVLAKAAAVMPESFLTPLVLAPAEPERIERRRAAYAAFLWKRLRGPRPWGPPQSR
jgi:hypothetical protein